MATNSIGKGKVQCSIPMTPELKKSLKALAQSCVPPMALTAYCREVLTEAARVDHVIETKKVIRRTDDDGNIAKQRKSVSVPLAAPPN